MKKGLPQEPIHYKIIFVNSVQQIKKAIELLPARQRCALARWLQKQENLSWDVQMDEDARSGQLQFLIDEAAQARTAGRLTKFP